MCITKNKTGRKPVGCVPLLREAVQGRNEFGDQILNRRREKWEIGLPDAGAVSSGIGFMSTCVSLGTLQFPDAQPPAEPQELQLDGQTVSGTRRQTS